MAQGVDRQHLLQALTMIEICEKADFVKHCRSRSFLYNYSITMTVPVMLYQVCTSDIQPILCI